jgi:hypothetical protein
MLQNYHVYQDQIRPVIFHCCRHLLSLRPCLLDLLDLVLDYACLASQALFVRPVEEMKGLEMMGSWPGDDGAWGLGTDRKRKEVLEFIHVPGADGGHGGRRSSQGFPLPAPPWAGNPNI